jgi:hypothetical protein
LLRGVSHRRSRCSMWSVCVFVCMLLAPSSLSRLTPTRQRGKEDKGARDVNLIREVVSFLAQAPLGQAGRNLGCNQRAVSQVWHFARAAGNEEERRQPAASSFARSTRQIFSISTTSSCRDDCCSRACASQAGRSTPLAGRCMQTRGLPHF